MKNLRKILTGVLFLGLLLGTACGEGEPTPSMTEALAVETAVSDEETVPTPRPTTTVAPPTPEPTPITPYIDAVDQPITDEGELIFPRVVTTQDGWLVVYGQEEDALTDILGYAPLSAGINEDIIVEIDPRQATPTVVAMLHVDEDPAGEFEYPDGPDDPLEYETAVIATPIQLQFQLSQPVITIANQEVTEEGLLAVESVLTPIAGWLVIHADDHGELGKYLGSVPLEEGLNEALSVRIPWRDGTPTLYAVIYEDNGRSQMLDLPGEDIPYTVNGSPVIEAFNATYPPDVYVLDQPIVNGEFVVERVISNGPGYLVAYYDNEGQPGLIIGSQAIDDGLNEQVTVQILESALTSILHIRLHQDTEPGDDFDFPRVDPPVYYQDRLPTAVTFSTEPGNYLIAADQPISQTESIAAITIPYAVVDVPAWVVIYGEEDGLRGEILGFAPLEVGINRNVVVEVAAEQVTDTLYAGLYLDAEVIGEFEPAGGDVPLQRSRQIIQVPFRILREE